MILMAFRITRSLIGALAGCVLAAAPAGAQKVLLQIKPHVGDTIKMHLTQTIEMSGTRVGNGADSTKTMTTSTEIFSRAIPFQWTPGGTLIHAITDSVVAGAAVNRSPLPSPAVLRVSADGAIEVVDDGDPSSEMRHLFAEMPATLPRKAVTVGEKWTKEMRIPLAGDPGAAGTVKAVLPVDSLSPNDEIAFISIKGSIARFVDPSRPFTPGGYRTSGTFTGSLQIDRALGWITDARSVISVRSEIAEKSLSRNSGKPLRIQTKVSVWSRAVKQR